MRKEEVHSYRKALEKAEKAETVHALKEALEDVERGNLLDIHEALDALKKKHGL